MHLKLPSQPLVIRLACTLFSLIAIGYLIVEGKEIMAPFVFACLFSVLLLPLAKYLENKWKFRRNMASMSAVLLMVICIGGIFYFLGAQMSRLSDDWPQFKEQLNTSINDLQHWISRSFHISMTKQANYVKDATTKMVDTGASVAGATLVSVSSIVIFTVFTMIYTFFFLLYRGLILKFLVKVFKEENSALVVEIIEQVQYIVRKYIVGLLIEMSIVSVVVSIVFTLMGVKYAVLLGVVTGIFNLVPYIGIFSAIILSSLITFASAAVASKVLWVVIVLVIVHLLDSNILLPVIVGSKVKINAMITVLGVVLGEMIWGIPGMFLSIPVIAVLKIIFDRIEPLQPWGLLLGEDDTGPKTAVERTLTPEPTLEDRVGAELQQPDNTTQ